MILTGLNVSSDSRIKETSNGIEVKDFLIDNFSRGAGKITASFGDLFFYLLPAGELLGADDSTNSITTGFYSKFYDTSGAVVDTTAVGKIDKYETEDKFVYKATASKSITNLTSNLYIAKVEVYYKGDAGTTAQDVMILESTALSTSSLAELNASDNKKGIAVSSGNDVELSFDFVIEVAKQS